MDWMALISLLLTTILPMIINKAPAVSKIALQRWCVFCKRQADAATEPLAALSLFAVGELCSCMSCCETQAEQQQLLAAASDGFAQAKPAVEAALKAKASLATAA